MKRLSKRSLTSVLTCLLAAALCLSATTQPARDQSQRRQGAEKLFKDGNWKEAFNAYSELALDPTDDAASVGQDLTQALECENRLGKIDERDDLREKVVATHAGNWRLLWSAAQTFATEQHYGFMVAGKFYRGPHRGNDGKQVFAMDRDRVRMLQLMQDAADKVGVGNEKASAEVGHFYLNFAQAILFGWNGPDAWRLQYKLDLTKLPDYEETYNYYGNYNPGRGAPVNADGTPVYHHVPKAYAEAASDGERWRWCLQQAINIPEVSGQAKFTYATFLNSQFGVETMGYYGGSFRHTEEKDDTRKDESGPFAVSTLGEDETIARLANGIKRFKLPDEFNAIKVYQEMAEVKTKEGWHEGALTSLAQIFTNRQQYDRSAEYWKMSIADHGDPNDHWKQKQIDQIIGNWAMFDPIQTQPAGKEALVDLRFRNGNKVSFEASPIDTKKLLEDVKTYLKSNPGQLSWEQVDIQNLGFRLVEKAQSQYLLKDGVEKWDLELKPRDKHFDKRMVVKTPLKKAGAYLVQAKMAGGNVSNVIVWVADTVIVKKPLIEGFYYYVADAITGNPVPKAELKFFGYQQQQVKDRQFQVNTREFAETTDKDGQAIVTGNQGDGQYQWLITTNTEDGRLAYLGFEGIWHGRNASYDYEYNANKCFVMTDRPVYRPYQVMKFKAWMGHAKYDEEGNSPQAGQQFTAIITNPKGEKILEKGFTADAYGGIEGELTLPKDAPLGTYGINIVNWGGNAFRVEEYKKPEFEVKVDAPSVPIMLGEKITATINCKYYFGAPVVDAKVKFKVMRQDYAANWYPSGRWDWFYEPGYWWFAEDYLWFPGFREWGCMRPHPMWWRMGSPPPEIVSENEVPVDKDGKVQVDIDTATAKEMHGDTDHQYTITAEVTDQSRRTIVGTGSVMVARKPFKVYAWVNRGYYQTGDDIRADFSAQSLDKKPIQGTGELKLLKVSYDKEMKPTEAEVQKWALNTDEQGRSNIQIKAADPGQYRISYKVTDEKKHAIEGGYVFVIRGKSFDGKDYRFNDIELTPDKKEYAPTEAVKLQINTNKADGTVLLFAKPANGIYLPPKLIHMKGKSTVEEIEVVKRDMPNMFVEALTIANGRAHQETREIVVPPEKRVLDVQVTPSSSEYKPGQDAKVKIKLTDSNGEPFEGSTVVSIYDKSVEYISGGSNVPDIKSFFWKWRRGHYPNLETTLARYSQNVIHSHEIPMQYLGVFGAMVADWNMDGEKLSLQEESESDQLRANAAPGMIAGQSRREASAKGMAMAAAPLAAGTRGLQDAMKRADKEDQKEAGDAPGKPENGQGSQLVEPTIRKNFADTALWVGSLTTGKDGEAEVQLKMPENLTTWKAKVWAMGRGTQVGEGSAEVFTKKNLILRLQAPRFFTQKDQVILSANVHNYLKTKKTVQVSLELDGPSLLGVAPAQMTQSVVIDAGGEKRVDWTVAVVQPGEATVRMKAVTDEESDAMQQKFPVYIHGMLKTDSFSGAMRPKDNSASLTFKVPAERVVADSRLEIRYSPSVASAMVDALPYLSDYPYGCTEQTLNRFLPTVITQKTLKEMHIDLKAIHDKQVNLNAQEIGNDKERAEQWKMHQHPDYSPVFDEAVVQDMVRAGLDKLVNMQLSDGGWGWFSGFGEQSTPHTTAVVVHGLQKAQGSDVVIPPNVMERGIAWLKNYQAEQIHWLQNHDNKVKDQRSKEKADDLDAFVFMVLVDGNYESPEMLEYLYRDRNDIGVYSKAMYGLSLFKKEHKDKLEMILRNISQYVAQDPENQTAYLKLPENNSWWYWYGSDTEAMAYYLKLLSKTDPKGEVASQMSKYLINNRKHATYWNSTRDTALCVEALSEFVQASGEGAPDMTVEIAIDGKKAKEVSINAANLFSFDNKLVLSGADVPDGVHKVEFTKKGTGPLYFNAYVTNFTLEDHITRAGLEIKVNRKYYKLKAVDKKIKVEGAHGQALDQKVEKYEREELSEMASLKSGDLIECEMEIDSKNDYEYILFEDMKAAGFEPVEVRSGYNGNDLHAYVEFRDERVCFFAHTLARGKHSVSYRLRAEIPGKFSALPTKASAMYAPELKANSDEFKIGITD